MKIYWLTGLLCSSAPLAEAQQNLFNAPSGDITIPKELFYQQQINFYSGSSWESKSHFVYGLGKNWDAGINLVDLPIQWSGGGIIPTNDQTRPYFPVWMVTLQKQWGLSDRWDLNIGTQAGSNFGGAFGNTSLSYWNYAGFRHQMKKGYFIGGLYQTTDTYAGEGVDLAGVWFGFELHLSDKWYLMGDFISGNNKKSSSTMGVVYNLSDRIQLCSAGLFSIPNPSTSGGFVLELNVFTYDFRKAE